LNDAEYVAMVIIIVVLLLMF